MVWDEGETLEDAGDWLPLEDELWKAMSSRSKSKTSLLVVVNGQMEWSRKMNGSKCMYQP